MVSWSAWAKTSKEAIIAMKNLILVLAAFALLAVGSGVAYAAIGGSSTTTPSTSTPPTTTTTPSTTNPTAPPHQCPNDGSGSSQASYAF
jgi:hypothetical protein